MFVVVDLETTTGNVFTASICQIGAVVFSKKFEVIDKLFIDNIRPIDNFSSIASLNLLDKSHFDLSVPILNALEGFEKVVKDTSIFFSWESFDWWVLQRHYLLLDREFPFKNYIDIASVFRYKFFCHYNLAQRVSLVEAAHMLNVQVVYPIHQALNDALTAKNILEALRL